MPFSDQNQHTRELIRWTAGKEMNRDVGRWWGGGVNCGEEDCGGKRKRGKGCGEKGYCGERDGRGMVEARGWSGGYCGERDGRGMVEARGGGGGLWGKRWKGDGGGEGVMVEVDCGERDAGSFISL